VTPRRRALLASSLLVALAACSGGSSDAGRSAASATSSSVATVTTSTASSPPTGTPGCGREPDVARLGDEPPGDVAATFTSDGVERAYRLSVPPGYDPEQPAPLIFNLHGSGSNALQASVYGDVPQRAAEEGYLVVTPEAIDGKWQLGGTGTDGDFLIGLLDDIESRYCIDQDRTHIMGMSLGAWKAAATACSFPGRFASAALVTVEVFPGACEPLPVIAFHGTGDHVVPYGEGADPGITIQGFNANLPGAVANIEQWAASGGCAPEPEISEIGDDVTRRRFTDCDPGIDVELYTIAHGDHTWPGADIDISGHGGTTQTIDATNLALAWFADHPARG
jgi:polyhydroxybutyrate depolymerase